MEVTITPLASPSVVVMRFEWDDLSTLLDAEWKVIKDRLEIKGYRKGRVPRAVAEQRLGVGEIYKTTVTESVNKALDSIKKDIVHVDKIIIVQFEKNKPIIMRTHVDMKPKVNLKKTSNFDVTITKMPVTAGMINTRIKKLQVQQSISMSVEGRGSMEGDFVDIQSTILVDGKPFDNNEGKYTGRLKVGDLKIGASINSLIKDITTEDRPTGEVEFPNTFPHPLLREKKAMVTFEILNVTNTEVPEINDEFAKSNGYKNLKDLKHHCEMEAEEENNKHRDAIVTTLILDKLIELNEVGPIPDSLFRRQIRIMLSDYVKRIGISEEEFFTQTKTSMNHFQNQNADLALHRIKTRLILEAALDVDPKVNVTEEEIDAQLKKVAAMADRTFEDLNVPGNRTAAKNDIGTERELKKIKKTVTVIEKEPAEK